jgi:alpha-1,2-mannosyltransferase
MALVAFDCLLPRTRWPRGVLVGVAAALKLTPAVFVLYFLASRQYRAAAQAAASLAAVTGIGFLLAPADSVRYWTNTVFQTGRVGSQSFFDNQSLAGMLSRAGLTGHSFTAAWLGCCAVVAGLGFIAIRSTSARRDTPAAALSDSSAGDDALSSATDVPGAADDVPTGKPGRSLSLRHQVLPLCLTACVSLCVSPIAWSHHWVWAAPALLTALLLAKRDRDRRRLWLGGAALALFVVFPASWFPRGNNLEVYWAWWQQVLGSAYVWVSVGLLAYFAVTAIVERRRTGRCTQVSPQPETVGSARS